MHGFCRNFQHYTGFVYYLFFSFQWVLSFLYVYSDHSILECYNLFSGVELSMRSFFVILIKSPALANDYWTIINTTVTEGSKHFLFGGEGVI